MHIQVVTYRMENVSESDFMQGGKEFAEMMARVPGLLAKIWLKGADADVYGGVYLWQDQAACESFLAGGLWAGALTDESMLDVVSRDFAVTEELTRLTQPGMQLLD